MMSWSPMRIVPAVGSSSPATMRSVVVLPQPDGPSSAKNEPCGIGEVEVVDRGERAEALGDAGEPQVAAVAARRRGPSRLGRSSVSLRSASRTASLYFGLLRRVGARKTCDLANTRVAGKISWLSADLRVDLHAGSPWRPSPGQM